MRQGQHHWWDGPDIVVECPVSKVHDGGLQGLHSADDVVCDQLTARNADESTCKISRLSTDCCC